MITLFFTSSLFCFPQFQMPPSSLKTSSRRPPIRLARSSPPASHPTPPPLLDAAAAAAAPMARLPRPPSRVAFLPVLCLLLLLAAAAPLALARGAPGAGTIHELLRSHGLPGGLLPRGVESYTLDEGNGLLEARLSAPCYAKYDDGDLAFFDTVVRGNLSFGALRGVEGLAQEELFVWLPVKGILVADPGSGVILFDIGYAHKRLSRSLFEEPPDCKPSAATGMGAAEAARWRDSKGIPGLGFRGEAGGEGHHQDSERRQCV